MVRKGKLSVIGNGVVVDPWALADEIGSMAKALDIFRQNPVRAAQLGVEKAEGEARMVAERKETAERVALEFESKVARDDRQY